MPATPSARPLRPRLDNGLAVFTAARGCTRSHQVILEYGGFVSPEGVRIKVAMERCGILADALVRIGTQDVTRRGMGEAEMRTIAGWIADAALGRRAEPDFSADVAALATEYQAVQYCFDAEGGWQLSSTRARCRQPP